MGTAWFSADYRYRYWLRRDWGPGAVMTFVMLNPSTAGATADDQTVRACCRFAAREGCRSMVAVNLHALIATDPGLLAREQGWGVDTVGGKFADWCLSAAIEEAKASGGKVVLAWGRHGERWQQRAWEAEGMAYRSGAPWPYALGWCGNGQPRHPCRLAANTPLLPYPPF
jgi:hypothetical protein